MTSSNRESKDISTNRESRDISTERQSLTKDRQSTSSRASKISDRQSLTKERQSTSNRESKAISTDRQSLTKDRQSTSAEADNTDPCLSTDPINSFLSIYNVRFPANICEHQPPNFAWQPAPSPGRGGGSIFAPTEKVIPSAPGTRKSPRSPRVRPPEPSVAGERLHASMAAASDEARLSRDSRLSATEVKIIKRETKNR